MTRVEILPVPKPTGDIAYFATAGGKESHGKTAGEALDALTAQLPEEDAGTLIIVQNQQPDRFFGAAQQQRLAELMTRWRTVRDAGSELPEAQQRELDTLIEEELHASAGRTAALLNELG